MNSHQSERHSKSALKGVSRRSVLQGVAALAGTAAAPLRSLAADTTIRWWSTQSSPEQLKAYRYQIETFEQAHPGIKVVFERTSDEGYATQLAAAFAGGTPPHLITHLPSFAVADYWNAGLVAPFDKVIESIGPEAFFPGANDAYEISRAFMPPQASAILLRICFGCAPT